jgi:ubiquinone/menaquinone biosynthesis C-methylase UbiE
MLRRGFSLAATRWIFFPDQMPIQGEKMLNFAGWYDSIFECILGGLRRVAARAVPPRDGLSVLDIGCGTGSQLAIYAESSGRVCGIDLSEPMLGIARSKLGESAVLAKGNALNLPYAAGTFDLVMSSLFFHQLQPEQRTAVLCEALRVLGPDGQIMLIDFHVKDRHTIIGKLTYAFISIIEFFAGREHFNNSRDFLANGGIPTLAEAIGFRVKKAFVVGNGNLGVYLLTKVE